MDRNASTISLRERSSAQEVRPSQYFFDVSSASPFMRSLTSAGSSCRRPIIFQTHVVFVNVGTFLFQKPAQPLHHEPTSVFGRFFQFSSEERVKGSARGRQSCRRLHC